ncbi:MAG: sensor histidine kinase [Limnohabitans sp.]
MRAPLFLLAAFMLAFCATPLQAQPVHEFDSAFVTAQAGATRTQATVPLPYHWDKHHPGQQGFAVFELRFELAASKPQELAIAIPKTGNAFKIWLNGSLLAHEGDLDQHNGSDHGQLPRYYLLPPDLLQPTNVLKIQIKADMGRRGGLSRVTLGPAQTVKQVYWHAFQRQVMAAVLVATFSFIVGAVALALWLTQIDRGPDGKLRRDRLYRYAMTAELVWSFGMGYVMLENPPLMWPWWGMLSIMALSVWACAMAFVCIEVAGWHRSRWSRLAKRWSVSLVALCPVMTYLAIGHAMSWMLTLWYGLLAVTMLVFSVFFCWHALRGAPWSHRYMAFAILMNVFAGLRDLYAFRIDPQYPPVSLLRVTSTLFGLALLYIVISRFKSARVREQDLLGTLETRVQERELQLKASFEREERFLLERERTAERGRILQDMHDGVGAHLSTAIRQVESGHASKDALLATLRDSLDQLKLTIDTMSLVAGDINGLLADLRYRLGPRFASAGLEVEWLVEILPLLERLDPADMRQLQFILFEAFSNVLQHARASRLIVSGRLVDGSAIICMEDNGIGFDTSTPARNGLLLMNKRAAAIGVSLQWHSQPGQTVLCLTILNTVP